MIASIFCKTPLFTQKYLEFRGTSGHNLDRTCSIGQFSTYLDDKIRYASLKIKIQRLTKEIGQDFTLVAKNSSSWLLTASYI